MNEALQMRPNAANIPPRNAADAAARFLCSPMGHVTGQRCVELYRDGERRRTPCSGCAAGKARARLLDAAVKVVEIAARDPEVAELRALLTRTADALVKAEARIGALELRVNTLANRATRRSKVDGIRLKDVGFYVKSTFMTVLRQWCLRHKWSLSRLARAAICAAAADMGVALEDVPTGVCRGFSAGTTYKAACIMVPETWMSFIDGLRSRRQLSKFANAALTAYMEAHP